MNCLMITPQGLKFEPRQRTYKSIKLNLIYQFFVELNYLKILRETLRVKPKPAQEVSLRSGKVSKTTRFTAENLNMKNTSYNNNEYVMMGVVKIEK